MKQRTITAVIMAIVFLPVLIFSQYIVYQITLALLCAVAIYEMLGVFDKRADLFVAIPAYLLALAAPIITYFAAAGTLMFFMTVILVLISAYLLWLFGVAVFRRGKMKFSELSSVFTFAAYIVVAFSALGLMRKTGDGTVGVLLLGLVFTCAWMTDIFAYITGRLLGKHKLIPEISPKKTVEGAIGGIVFSTAAFALYGLIVDSVTAYSVNYLVLVLTAPLLSVVSQMGDLIASLVKRERGIKDYGTIFPGHGGVLDRFDSIIAVAFVLMVVCAAFPPFQ